VRLVRKILILMGKVWQKLRDISLGDVGPKIDYQRSKCGPLPRSSNFADVELDTEDEGVLAEATIV
jgi:hypothetical protein